MSNATKDLIRKWLDEAWGGHPEVTVECVTPLYIRHEGTGTRTVRAEDYANEIAERQKQITFRVDDIEYTGDRCWARWTMLSTKDGRPLRAGLQVYRIEDGRLAETWNSMLPDGVLWDTPSQQ